MVRAIPLRNLRKALRYWKPYRLTLLHNSPIYAWLWWNFKTTDENEVKLFRYILLQWLKGWWYIIPHPSLWIWYIQNIRTEWHWRGVEWWHRY